MMYEQNEVPVIRRILWLALWFIVAVAVLWLLVWFIFFRHTGTKKVTTPPKTTTQQHQPTQKPQNRAPSGSSPTTGSSGSGTQNQPSAPSPSPSTGGTTTTPPELANTGAGDVITPAAVATVVGGALYYVRLRKKLQS